VPLILGLAMVNVGWATGGGAAQILFTVFGELVFNRGPYGLGLIWGCAGVGLVCGGGLAYAFGRRLSFANYKRAIVVCYIVHGGSYILFSQVRSFTWALVFIALSRAGVGFSSVMNMSQLLRHVPDQFRGRVFATMETTTWSVMMISMLLAGVASQYWDPRTIGTIAGALSSTTAIFWGWAEFTGRLPEPAREGVEPEEIEIHGEPTCDQLIQSSSVFVLSSSSSSSSSPGSSATWREPRRPRRRCLHRRSRQGRMRISRASCGRMLADRADGGYPQVLFRAPSSTSSRMCGQACVQFLVAGRDAQLRSESRVGALQGFQGLLLETGDILHGEYRRQRSSPGRRWRTPPGPRPDARARSSAPMLPEFAGGITWDCRCPNRACGAPPGPGEISAR
jgi:hypothetical protein